MGWSPDGALAYLNDSEAQVTYVFSHDPERGPVNRHVLLQHSEGHPDGLCVDAAGGLWIAFYGAGQVRRFDADGALTDVVDVPVSRPTACCLGGDDLRTLFITTSREGLEPGDEPAAGSVYSCRVAVAGLEVAGFAG